MRRTTARIKAPQDQGQPESGRQQPHMRPGVPAPHHPRRVSGPSAERQHQEHQQEGNDTPVFLEQLQIWAANTVKKELEELETEFTKLQRQPRPEPSSEFLRNTKLNRYRDVVCVENNRVILANGRYIHANWIEANGERRFICTQGPLSQTVDDFWALVLQEKIEAVVMLCNTLELNRPKCVQYWPEDNSPNSVIQSEDGNIRVAFANQEKLDNHLIKTRLLVTSKNPKQQQVVRHFHWRDWPDRGVPMNHLAALRLLYYLGPYKRIIVHCSAGIGRTGTIVTVYLAQTQMRHGLPLDLFEQVQKLRQQRAGSVQTLDQYFYIYSVLLKYASNKAERGHIQLDSDAAQRLIQAIAKRIYKM